MPDPVTGILGSLFAAVAIAWFKSFQKNARLNAELKESKAKIKELESKIQSLESELVRKQVQIDDLAGGTKTAYQQKAIIDYDPFDS